LSATRREAREVMGGKQMLLGGGLGIGGLLARGGLGRWPLDVVESRARQ
jgi:hypothetical protein